MIFPLFLFIVSLAFATQPVPNSQLIISDCGDKTYLLHYVNVTATEFKRGKDVIITSEKELLSADITSGTVKFNVLRNDVGLYSLWIKGRSVFSHTTSTIVDTRKRAFLWLLERSSTLGPIAPSPVHSRIPSVCLWRCLLLLLRYVYGKIFTCRENTNLSWMGRPPLVRSFSVSMLILICKVLLQTLNIGNRRTHFCLFQTFCYGSRWE